MWPAGSWRRSSNERRSSRKRTFHKAFAADDGDGEPTPRPRWVGSPGRCDARSGGGVSRDARPTRRRGTDRSYTGRRGACPVLLVSAKCLRDDVLALLSGRRVRPAVNAGFQRRVASLIGWRWSPCYARNTRNAWNMAVASVRCGAAMSDPRGDPVRQSADLKVEGTDPARAKGCVTARHHRPRPWPRTAVHRRGTI
jgi:hypothetical protein